MDHSPETGERTLSLLTDKINKQLELIEVAHVTNDDDESVPME